MMNNVFTFQRPKSNPNTERRYAATLPVVYAYEQQNPEKDRRRNRLGNIARDKRRVYGEE
jgi:hypothetical protein